MSFFYRLEDGFSFLNKGIVKKIDYLPIKKKKYLSSHDEIFIYIKNDRGSGIFAIGRAISDKIYKSSEIPKEERDKLIKRDFFQIKIHIHLWSVIPFIEDKHLRQFPSYNHKNVQKPLNPFTLYYAGAFAWEYKFLHFRFAHYFRKGEPFFPDSIWKLLYI
jgi:hypothetical protein